MIGPALDAGLFLIKSIAVNYKYFYYISICLIYTLQGVLTGFN